MMGDVNDCHGCWSRRISTAVGGGFTWSCSVLEAGVGVGQGDPAAMRTKAFGGDVSARLSPGHKMYLHGFSRTLSSGSIWCGFGKVAFGK